ncbi:MULTISPECIES: hypothetical protein [Streptosporangium]|uniref:Uncharacterized protein n=1 Tax=Streptosporangium brasiliense TaxID=47480 RepID=A0ABT9R4G6_9ACTN|nr:hypothetical protein [Streptosporangium brasiliense]MDP9864123.1 hypothetical protein [Streptosporangium brasiliense]
MTPDATADYERRCRLLIRLAYPPRFREFRGAELMGTLMDLAGPDQSSPTLRECLDVIRGGLMLRLREHPPLWHWLLYRLTPVRLPWKYRWWARDDIQGRFFLERRLALALLLDLPILLVITQSPPSYAHMVGALFVYLIVLPSKGSMRRTMLAKHEFHPDGTSYFPRPPEFHPESEAYELRPDHLRRTRRPGH